VVVEVYHRNDKKKGYWRAGHAASGKDRSVAEFQVGGCARTEAALVFNSPCKDTHFMSGLGFIVRFGVMTREVRPLHSPRGKRFPYLSQLGFKF